MSFLEILEFVFRLFIYKVDAAAVVWAAVAFLLSLFIVGLGWGKLWNRDWGLFSHAGNLILSFFCALLLAATVIGFLSADRALERIEGIRDVVTRELVGSGSSNREVLRSAWDKLQPLGGQGDLVPPAEGGNELRLNSQEEALILAEVAADAAQKQLRLKPPFNMGVPLITRPAEELASAVTDGLSSPVYPVTVGPDNEWAKSSATLQASNAMDQAMATIKLPAQRLKNSLLWFGITLLSVQILLIVILALADIKANPTE